MRRVFAQVLCFVCGVGVFGGQQAIADVTYPTALWISTRVDGVYAPFPLTVVGVSKTGDNGTEGCPSAKYDDLVITSTEADDTIKSATLAYWDWVYVGFTSPGEVDYLQNCHGFAYGVHTWPVDSSAIMTGTGTNVCWVPGGSDATIAAAGSLHSVQITLEDCGSPGYIIKTLKEQFRESGTYTSSGSCAHPVPGTSTALNANLYGGRGVRDGLSFTFLEEQ